MSVPMAQPVLGPEELAAVKEVLDSGQLSLGPRVPAFEAAFAARVGARHACAVSSGTAGLHLGLRAAGVTDGDEVLTSPFSFVASANVILYERATPVFVDVDPDTLCVPADAYAAAVTERTRAILPVSIFGKRCEIPDVGLPVVEDACEALGSVPSRGHTAVYAFYPNKQMTTGEGGVVVTDDDAVKARIDSERNQGRAPDMGWLDHDRLGFNYRLTDIACAIGLVQLERLDGMLADRAKVAALYHEALAGLPVERLDDDRSWFVYVVRLPGGMDRDDTILALRERGIASKPYLPAIHLYSFYRERFGYRPGMFPVAEEAAARSVALPFFPQMTESQVAEVAEGLAAVIGI
ncbi:MAG: DegT/DnrJ/EryC1/StrS family aminotransferase [Solirubrobacteraceae bacterium]